jgi:methyl-accepting chemotaxis protein WspA
MKWTIGKKILAGYGVSIALVIVGCVMVYVNLQALEAEFESRTNSRDKLAALADIASHLHEVEAAHDASLVTGDEEALKACRNAKDRLAATFTRLSQLAASNPEQLAAIAAAQKDAATVFAGMDEAIRARGDQGTPSPTASQDVRRERQALGNIHASLAHVRTAEEAFARAALQSVHQRVQSLVFAMEVGAPAAIVAMLVLGILVSLSLSRPLTALTEAAQRIAGGNLSSSVTPLDRSDEVGMLSRSFAQMNDSLQRVATASTSIAGGDLTVDIQPRSAADDLGNAQAEMIRRLSELIGQVQQSGVQVNSSAVEIAAVAKQQQATASEVASTTTEISSTAREMSATSTELLKTADQVSTVAAETASLASQGKEKLNRMESTIRQISEASGAVTGRLGVMNEKAGNINAVITTITKVADQTNLLSLNAAIEAEKAGEYGRGFSVVASEIRRLADQTAASSGDIERIVKELISAVSAGVMGMDKFAEEVRRGATEIEDTRRQLDEVIVQVQSLAPSVETLHEGMRAQTQGAEQISDALSQLGEAARQTADSVRDSGRAVEQLNDAARGLQGAISRFKTRAS